MIVDLTHRLAAGMVVYPGDPETEIEPIEVAPGVRISRLRLGTHAGTHMDAPAHFLAGGLTIDEIPLDQCIGESVLVRCTGVRVIGQEMLRPHETEIRRARKVVIDTGWAARWGAEGYFDGHPVVSEGAARYLVACSVHLVGIDAPSVDVSPYPAHRVLLGAGAVIVENLGNLDRIAGPTFHFSAAPLRIGGGDGAPVRAFAIV